MWQFTQLSWPLKATSFDTYLGVIFCASWIGLIADGIFELTTPRLTNHELASWKCINEIWLNKSGVTFSDRNRSGEYHPDKLDKFPKGWFTS